MPNPPLPSPFVSSPSSSLGINFQPEGLEVETPYAVPGVSTALDKNGLGLCSA
ncbi:MAG: hypothetical protein K2X68_08160 [Novosphingobium sp.]|nr:hypothetical protein [Novosphingobium sp.]